MGFLPVLVEIPSLFQAVSGLLPVWPFRTLVVSDRLSLHPPQDNLSTHPASEELQKCLVCQAVQGGSPPHSGLSCEPLPLLASSLPSILLSTLPPIFSLPPHSYSFFNLTIFSGILSGVPHTLQYLTKQRTSSY